MDVHNPSGVDGVLQVTVQSRDGDGSTWVTSRSPAAFPADCSGEVYVSDLGERVRLKLELDSSEPDRAYVHVLLLGPVWRASDGEPEAR
jgi:hypothetical protein